MTYEVLKEIRVKTVQGETVLSSGNLINLDELRASKLIAAGKLKPIALIYLREERRQSLLDCMTATWETISKTHFKTGYKLTPEVKKAELMIEKLQAEVFEGKAKLEDFRKACINWEKAVRQDANGT